MEYNVFLSSYVVIGTLIYVFLPGSFVLGYASNEYLTTLSENVNYLSKLHERSMRFDKKIFDLRKEMQQYIEGNDKKLEELEAKLNTLESRKGVPTSSACQECPDSWVSFNGSCYLFGFETKLSFFDAETFCEQKDGYLVHVNTEEENSFLVNYLKLLKPADYWIGLTDSQTEGHWKWYNTNTTPSFTLWRPGQPDDYKGHSVTGEDCAHFAKKYAFTWNDIYCTTKYKPLCEHRSVND